MEFRNSLSRHGLLSCAPSELALLWSAAAYGLAGLRDSGRLWRGRGLFEIVRGDGGGSGGFRG